MRYGVAGFPTQGIMEVYPHSAKVTFYSSIIIQMTEGKRKSRHNLAVLEVTSQMIGRTTYTHNTHTQTLRMTATKDITETPRRQNW